MLNERLLKKQLNHPLITGVLKVFYKTIFQSRGCYRDNSTEPNEEKTKREKHKISIRDKVSFVSEQNRSSFTL